MVYLDARTDTNLEELSAANIFAVKVWHVFLLHWYRFHRPALCSYFSKRSWPDSSLARLAFIVSCMADAWAGADTGRHVGPDAKRLIATESEESSQALA